MFFQKPRQHKLDSDLLSAVKVGDVEATAGLLKRGANPNASDEGEAGECALHLTFHTRVFGVSSPGERHESFYNVEPNMVLLDLLLSHGANPDTKNSEGETPLLIVSQWQRLNAVNLLLRHGADPNAGDQLGMTSLMKATIHGSIDPEEGLAVIRALLGAGADVNILNENGTAALEYALDGVTATDAEKLKLLLDAGTNADIMSRALADVENSYNDDRAWLEKQDRGEDEEEEDEEDEYGTNLLTLMALLKEAGAVIG